MLLRFILTGLLLGGYVESSCAAEPIATGETTRTLGHGGLERSYIIHVPPSYDGTKPFPVVLVLHGGASNAATWMPFCGMNETADKHGFIVVYPNGTGRTVEGYGMFGWNGGPHRPGGEKPELNKIDDVGFIGAVLDDVEKSASIDKRRLFATGMSMGGIMVYRLASELSPRIAAIAPISGSMGTETCAPVRPVPVVHFHGTDDPAVPLTGGKGRIDKSGAVYLSAEHTMRAWTIANGCDFNSSTEMLPDTTQDGTSVIRQSFGRGKEGSEVQLITILGGGHTWPGRDFGPEMAILGKSSKDISANEMMWEFFSRHPMP